MLFAIPLTGGVLVGVLRQVGGAFPPGLRGIVQEVDSVPSGTVSQQIQVQSNFFRKSTASVVTLGTGNSLGPEGPCVEIGMHCAQAASVFNRKSYSRNAALPISPSSSLSSEQQQLQLQTTETEQPISLEQQRYWNRILLACGAASGVAAGFNAPIAGVFFALEIMQNAFQSIDQKAFMEQQQNPNGGGNNNPVFFSPITATTTTIAPILIASVLAALVSQDILGNNLIFKVSQVLSIQTPLVEFPLYLLLGCLCGVVAFVFSYSAKLSQQFFAGELGADFVKNTMSNIPDAMKPAIAGLVCGLVGLAFPQILFFGYETLNPLLNNKSLPLTLIMSLLSVKTLMTAFCAGSGLVGGTFAPSLFLGAMSGAAFQTVAHRVVQGLGSMDATTVMVTDAYNPLVQFQQSILPALQLADVPAYAMVGAASVLAALFRAPLTATLLLFEVTRNYDVLLPLMASAGLASIISDVLEDTFERREEMQRRDLDPVSWGALSLNDDGNEEEMLTVVMTTQASSVATTSMMATTIAASAAAANSSSSSSSEVPEKTKKLSNKGNKKGKSSSTGDDREDDKEN